MGHFFSDTEALLCRVPQVAYMHGMDTPTPGAEIAGARLIRIGHSQASRLVGVGAHSTPRAKRQVEDGSMFIEKTERP